MPSYPVTCLLAAVVPWGSLITCITGINCLRWGSSPRQHLAVPMNSCCTHTRRLDTVLISRGSKSSSVEPQQPATLLIAVIITHMQTNALPSSVNPMQLFEEHEREYQALMRPGPLKIGIQIRTGDNRLGESTITLETYKHFFQCAAQIEVKSVASMAFACTTCLSIAVLERHQKAIISRVTPACLNTSAPLVALSTGGGCHVACTFEQ
jgi:hypothetical protein